MTPSHRNVQQNFDNIGRLSSVADTLGTTNTTRASAFAYNAAFQVTGFNYGNGVAAAFGYTPDRLLLESLAYTKGATTLFSANYWYKTDSTNCPNGAAGNNGQIQCITDNVDSGRTVAYAYDSLYRLTSAMTNGSANYPQWGLSWTYDRYGNRTAQTNTADSPPSDSLAVDATTNRITSTGFSYDANGNMIADGNNTLVYDAENRVLSATNGGASGSYTYDGNNLRVKKVSGGTTTVYIFSGTKVIAEYDNGAVPTAPTREYIYSGGALLAKVDSSGSTYYHPDQLSNRLVTDSSGNLVAQMGHYPFGDSWYNSANDKLQFTTYSRDSESGNDYAMARSYVNRLGRFSSPDPLSGSIGNPQSLNKYAYTLNDPGNLIDPSGLGPVFYFPAYNDPFFALDYLITGEGFFGHEGTWSNGNFNGAAINWILGQPDSNNPVPVPGGGNSIPCLNGVGPLQPGQSRCPASTTTMSPGSIQECKQRAAQKAYDSLGKTIDENQFLPLKQAALGAVDGAIIGCLFASEAGCIEGAVPAAMTGALGGLIEGSGESVYHTTVALIRARKQYNADLAACGN